MKISALLPCPVWQRQESRPRTTGPARCDADVSVVAVTAWCWCRHPATVMKSVGRVKKRDEKRKKAANRHTWVFQFSREWAAYSLRVNAYAHIRTNGAHIHTLLHKSMRDSGAEAHKDKRKNLDPARWRSWRSVSLCWRGAYHDWSSWIPWRSPNPITRGLTYLSAHAVESCLLEEKGPGTRLSPTWVVLSVTIDMFVHLLDPSGTMV